MLKRLQSKAVWKLFTELWKENYFCIILIAAIQRSTIIETDLQFALEELTGVDSPDLRPDIWLNWRMVTWICLNWPETQPGLPPHIPSLHWSAGPQFTSHKMRVPNKGSNLHPTTWPAWPSPACQSILSVRAVLALSQMRNFNPSWSVNSAYMYDFFLPQPPPHHIHILVILH